MPSPFSSSRVLCAGFAFVIFAPALFARSREITAPTDTSSLVGGNCRTRVECITPDGHAHSVTLNQRSDGGLIIKDGESFNCRLAEGENTFILALPRSSTLEHVTFVNENVTACGRLRISVADQELPALSARWVPVDGSVAFAHKRLFNVSMLGVTAKFVRLTFSVQPEMAVTKANVDGHPIAVDFATVDAISVYKFRPNRNGLFAAENTRALAGNGLGHVTGNLAMADTALGFAARY